MKQKNNYSLINCFKKSFQILKERIKKEDINFKNQLKKFQQRTINKKNLNNLFIFKSNKIFNRKQAKRKRTQYSIE